MGFTDRQERRREREAQRREEIRNALNRAQTIEDLIEIIEREEEVEVEDELTGETYTRTYTEYSSPRLQQFDDVCEKKPVLRRKVSEESLKDAQDAYDENNALELARYAFEVVSGFDVANDTIDDEDE